MKNDAPSNVVADEAEASDARVVLHDPSEGGLGILGHAVGLVEDDDLEGRSRVRAASSVS